MMNPSPYYNKKNLWLLYTTCAFPLLFWALLLAFRDVSWLTERTNIWDAVGVISYGMTFALVESVIWFAVTALLGMLVLRRWGTERRAALMGALFLIVSFWSIAEQSYFVFSGSIPPSIAMAIASTGRPVFSMYVIALGLTSISAFIPAYFILHSEKALHGFMDFMERLSTLTALYLFFSLAGLVVILIRNIQI